ncbi:hypothetical protein NDU88_004674 [Pleurodeles waltl]|uniref:Uncharacterized protein n=1 Tax=Pleurodeles waltl TaxID=8319 RepID=A0AAV7TRX9_PLEWA|nr:hypothetical protein NDU88_004674 [Pleurodeles waltl]
MKRCEPKMLITVVLLARENPNSVDSEKCTSEMMKRVSPHMVHSTQGRLCIGIVLCVVTHKEPKCQSVNSTKTHLLITRHSFQQTVRGPRTLLAAPDPPRGQYLVYVKVVRRVSSFDRCCQHTQSLSVLINRVPEYNNESSLAPCVLSKVDISKH